MKKYLPALLTVLAAVLLSGCAVVVVTTAAASLAVDATVGAVKLTGKAVGAAVNAVTPSSGE